MSVALTMTGNDTINISGAGDTTYNGRYLLCAMTADIGYDLFVNEAGRVIKLQANGTAKIYQTEAVFEEYYRYQYSGTAWSTSIYGTSPAPTGSLARDQSTAHEFTFTSNNVLQKATAAGSSVINATYISAAGQVRYFTWNNGDLIVIADDEARNYLSVNGVRYYSASGTSSKPSSLTWSIQSGDSGTSPAPTFSDYFPAQPPTFNSATISRDGNKFTLNWQTVSAPPVVGTTGLTLGSLTNGAATLSNVMTSGTVTTADISRQIDPEEEPTVSYSPGDFEDSDGNEVASFTDQPVTNFSGQAAGGFLLMF